jgi:hypothetical protein
VIGCLQEHGQDSVLKVYMSSSATAWQEASITGTIAAVKIASLNNNHEVR